VPFSSCPGHREDSHRDLRGGATDYVLKDNLSRLVPSVVRALETAEPGGRTGPRPTFDAASRRSADARPVVAALAGVTEIRTRTRPDTSNASRWSPRRITVGWAVMLRSAKASEWRRSSRISEDLRAAEILSKPSRLSDAEFELVKSHALFGYEILKGIDFPWPVAQAAYQHHERLDGSGYRVGWRAKT